MSRRARQRLRAAGGLACLAGAAAGGLLAGGPAGPARLAGSQGSDPTGTAAAYLPLALRGPLHSAIREAATARARTATARAATEVGTTPTVTPTTALTVGPPSPSASVTASATDGAGETASATPQPPPATPSPSPSAPPSPSSSPSPSPTAGSPPPSRTPTPRNPAGERLRPWGALRPATTSVTYNAAAQTYRLVSRGTLTVTYELDLTHPDNSRGRLAVREVSSGRYPLAGAGLYYRRLDGVLIEPRLFSLVGSVTAIEHEALANGVRITVRERLQNADHAKRYTLTLVGRSLEWHTESLDPPGPAAGGYAGITAGDVEGTADGVGIRIPYMEAVPVTMLDHRWFASTLLEYPRSRASSLVPRGPEAVPGAFTNEVAALYEPNTQGRAGPIDETVWITLSPQVEDTFAVPDNAPSPGRDGLDTFVHVTLAGRPPAATFAGAAATLEALQGWGLQDLIVHPAHWRDPSVPSPAQWPPDPAAGGAAGFTALVARARGYLAPAMALTTTVASCPDRPNPLYRPQDRVVDSEGRHKRAEADFPCRDAAASPSYLLPPDAAQRVVLQEWDAWRDAGIRAVDLELLPAWNPAYPWLGATQNVLDRAAQTTHPGTIGAAITAYKRVFASLQERIGPVFGQGGTGAWELGYDSFLAGYLDGAARALTTGVGTSQPGSASLVVPDYELTAVRPHMANFGMGSYEQFFGTPGRPLSDAALDEWRATELAYGHAGAWTVGDPTGRPDYLTAAEQVKEYYLLQTLQRRYLDRTAVAAVSYVGVDGTERELSEALTHDVDLAEPRLHLRFGHDLELWLNHSQNLWTVPVAGESVLLPQHGWLARGPGLLGYSALLDGQRVDYLRSPEVTVLDGRGQPTDFDALTARDLKVIFPDGRVLEELPDGTLRWTTP